MRATIADKAELSPFELVHAAARLPRSTAAQAPAAVDAALTAAPSPPVMEASAAPFAPSLSQPPLTHVQVAPPGSPPEAQLEPSKAAASAAATNVGPLFLPLPLRRRRPQVCTALQLAGRKLIAAPAVAHALPSPSGAPLIYLKDPRTHTSYLVDTGAAVSLLPYSSPLYPPSCHFVQKKLHFGSHSLTQNFCKQK